MRTMAMPSLDDVAQEAAAGDEIKRYLAVRGIKTTATLALLATNLEQLDRVLVKPLMDGWPIEGSTAITLTPSEQPIATAILHHMWSECRSLWSKMQAAATPASFPTATPPSSHASGSAAPATEDKAPKQLAHGVWNKLLHNYERQQIDGRTRTFPVQEVLGAELVLARLHWEHETSKLYTPVKFGELWNFAHFSRRGKSTRSPRRSALAAPWWSPTTSWFNRKRQAGSPGVCWPSLMDWLPSSGPSSWWASGTRWMSWPSLTGWCAWPGHGHRRWIRWRNFGPLPHGSWLWRWGQGNPSRSASLRSCRTMTALWNAWTVNRSTQRRIPRKPTKRRSMAARLAARRAATIPSPIPMNGLLERHPMAPMDPGRALHGPTRPRRSNGPANPPRVSGRADGKARDSTGPLHRRLQRYPTVQLHQCLLGRNTRPGRQTKSKDPTWSSSAAFEGIGVAAMVLQDLVGPLALHVSWECDPECLVLLQRHFPQALHRGDFLEDDPKAVAELVRQADPDAKMTIIQASAPPCPDFSRIKDDAPGKEGAEGSKFPKYCSFAKAVREELPEHYFLQLCENVILSDQGEVEFFSQQLGVPAVIADASDYKAVSRPRLWWSSIDWTKSSPVTGAPLQWSKQYKLHKLHIDDWPTDLQHMETEGLEFHETVTSGRQTIPCFTTPAPTEAGRAAPRSMKGKLDPLVKSRWLSDGRCYAPWQYNNNALMKTPTETLVTPPAFVKEQLHHLPVGWTEDPNIPDRSRHRMIANSWHAGVARFLFMLLLGMVAKTEGKPNPHNHSPKMSTIQWMANETSCYPPSVGPGSWRSTPSCIPPAEGELHHWHLTANARHPLQLGAQLEPGLSQVVDFWQKWSHDLDRIRQEITEEVELMVEDRSEHTSQWWKALKPHVQAVCYNSEHDQITQIPIFVDLLRMFQFPEIEALASELNNGFKVTGELVAGPGWLPRTDDRYRYPISEDGFRKLNRAHVLNRLNNYRVDEHWEPMYQELLQELQLGRMEGPFEAPDWWPRSTIEIEGYETKALEQSDIRCAFSFAVCQADKIRRCEDYRRSGHNATVCTYDVPFHHGAQTYVEIYKSFYELGEDGAVWCQDLSAAYRQFAVDQPSDCYSILCCPQGPLLLRHRALCFGASSSVWSFNRAADGVIYLARRMAHVPTGHYVDDFTACEPTRTITSGYTAFETIFKSLGLRMKPRKAQPPALSQKVLGVQMLMEPGQVTLSPHPERLQKIRQQIADHLRSDSMTPGKHSSWQEESSSWTRRCSDRSGSQSCGLCMAEPMGVPSLRKITSTMDFAQRFELYTHGWRTASPGSSPSIRRHLRQSCTRMHTLKWVIALSRSVTTRFPRGGDHQQAPHYTNGWGFVVRTPHGCYYRCGRIPARVLKAYCHRKAFIYMLEITAHLAAMTILQTVMPSLVISFCDNRAGLSALLRGFGKDPAINRTLTLAWRLVHFNRWHLHMEWVASDNNISDKISRHDLAMAKKFGWQEVAIDMDPFYQILLRASADDDYVLGGALQDLVAFGASAPFFKGTGNVAGGRPSAVWKVGLPLFGPLQGDTPTKGSKTVLACLCFEDNLNDGITCLVATSCVLTSGYRMVVSKVLWVQKDPLTHHPIFLVFEWTNMAQ